MYMIMACAVGANSGIMVYSDESSVDEASIVSAELTLEVNTAGSLEITIPPKNQAYSQIHDLTTELVVYRHSTGTVYKEYWRGRVIMHDVDFMNNLIITCEGELAYLNDTIQPAREFNNTTVSSFLTSLLNTHNSRQSSNAYKFYVGTVNVDNNPTKKYRYTNYENTWTCITDKLLDRYSGVLRIRKENGTRYLDYLDDYPGETDQEIMYGENLIDISKKFDLSDFATVVIPLGARLENSRFADLDEYLTVASVNDGSIRIANDTAVANYGVKEVVLNFDDVEDATTLYNKGVSYLNKIQFDEMVVEINALDLYYVDRTVQDIDLMDYVQCYSRPHNLTMRLPVTRLEIPILNPSNATITLNGSKRGRTNKLSYLVKKNNKNTKKVAKITGAGFVIIQSGSIVSPDGMGQKSSGSGHKD